MVTTWRTAVITGLAIASAASLAQPSTEASRTDGAPDYIAVEPNTSPSEALRRGVLVQQLPEGAAVTTTGFDNPLLLRVKELPSAIAFDNGGSRFTGEHRLGGSLNLDNPFGLGDQLSVRGISTGDWFLLRQLSYLVPVGSYGTRLGASYLDFDYQIGKDFSALKLHGYGSVASLKVIQPIVRMRDANLILQFAYDDKELFDLDDANRSRSDTFVTSTGLGVVGDFRDGLFGGGLNAYSLTITEGEVNLAPFSVLAADQAVATGRKTLGQFARTNYEIRRLQKITDQTAVLLALAGQVASKNLAGIERFFLGGASGVRAYPPGEAGGDSGHIFTGEIRYLVPEHKLWGGDFALSAFYDVGWVRTNKNPLPPPNTNTADERSLAGFGFGVYLGKRADFQVRATAAWQAERERPRADGVRRNPRIWFQVAKFF